MKKYRKQKCCLRQIVRNTVHSTFNIFLLQAFLCNIGLYIFEGHIGPRQWGLGLIQCGSLIVQGQSFSFIYLCFLLVNSCCSVEQLLVSWFGALPGRGWPGQAAYPPAIKSPAVGQVTPGKYYHLLCCLKVSQHYSLYIKSLSQGSQKILNLDVLTSTMKVRVRSTTEKFYPGSAPSPGCSLSFLVLSSCTCSSFEQEGSIILRSARWVEFSTVYKYLYNRKICLFFLNQGTKQHDSLPKCQGEKRFCNKKTAFTAAFEFFKHDLSAATLIPGLRYLEVFAMTVRSHAKWKRNSAKNIKQ